MNQTGTMPAGGAQPPRPSLSSVLQCDERSGKANRLVVVLEDLSLTGCGDGFAKLKVRSNHLHDSSSPGSPQAA